MKPHYTYKNYLKIFSLVIFSLILFSSILSPIVSLAAAEDYIPLAPLPGTTNGNCTAQDIANQNSRCQTNMQKYLPGIYKIGIGFAGVLAVLMITWGGIEYMVSEAVSSKEAAKKKIWNAIGGLLLAFLSYVILYTVNPDLVNFNLNLNVGPVSNNNTPPAGTPPLKGQMYGIRRPSDNDCSRTDNLVLVDRVTTVGYVCSQSPNSNTKVRVNEVCCHWALPQP